MDDAQTSGDFLLMPPEMRRAASAVVQRDDGKWSIGWHDDVPGPFESRSDAARIANGDEPALVPGKHFRRINIREVRDEPTT